ncbi:MAG TPA: DUF6531 domain-containing protein [Allosphingosinicella sp.]|nr:DUF6531 domain-containing protein [Allosphingosinicella sp.]
MRISTNKPGKGIALALAALLASGSGLAQIVPPRHDTQSAAGVSYRNGSFSYAERDLSIGGEGQQGLTLERSYNSSVEVGTDFLSQGWTHSLVSYVSSQPMPINPDDPHPPTAQHKPFVYHVTFGGRSIGFKGGSFNPSTGGPVGVYAPVNPSGDALVFNGTTSAGYYTFTSQDGTVVNFTPGTGAQISNVTYPDGTHLDYTYNLTGAVRSVISNRGLAMLFESPNKVCAVNLAYSYVTATSSCPSDAQTATYGYTSGAHHQLLTSATKNGATRSYSYGGYDHLTCIQDPGQTICRIQNSYSVCPSDPNNQVSDNQTRLHDSVTSQTDGSGKTYQYSYSADSCTLWFGSDYRPFQTITSTSTVNGTAVTSAQVNTASMPLSLTDPISRTTGIAYQPNGAWNLEKVLPSQVTRSEGDIDVFSYDARGNIIAKTTTPKPGSGLASIVVSASYPDPCTNVVTCNKPDYAVDANGNRTDFTYDATHGGVLTETGPADASGVRPVKRHAYAQRYAWIKNSGGGYSQAATPVWVKTEERTCRSSATVGNACAAGSSDEVVTSYDYGPDSGPNNLWLRGLVVTADGQSRRVCYGYDRDGNKISETKARAGLATCS